MKGNLDRPVLVVTAKDENSMKLLVPKYWEVRGSLHPSSVLVTHATLANVLATGPAEKRAQAIPIAQQAVKLAPR
jgi:hypothetical protein